MGNEKNCDSVISEMLSDLADLSPEALAHVESCEKCKAELEKIKKLDALLKSAAPAVPSMKDAVLSKIERENISPAPVTSPRRHIPFGTIAAAAAVFAVGILVYKGDILDKVNDVEKSSDMIYVADQEAAEEEASYKYGLLCDSEQELILAAPETDKAPTVMYSKNETDDVTESVEAEAENTAPEEHKSLQSAKPEDAEPEKSNGIVEKDHLLSTAPPPLTDGGKNTVSIMGRHDVSDKSDADGTQGASSAINDDFRVTLSDYPLEKGETTATFDPTVTDTGTGAGRGSSGGASMGGGGVAKAPDDPQYDEFEQEDACVQTTTFDFNAFLSKITKDSDAAEIYKVLSQFYPDAISYETFENSDPDEYLAFVMSIEDFESEYTESAFLSFCGKILFVGYKNTEVL